MLARGDKPADIAPLFNVTVPCIYAYKEGNARDMTRPVAAAPIRMRPHTMPWVTDAMLTGGRAPVAKVRS